MSFTHQIEPSDSYPSLPGLSNQASSSTNFCMDPFSYRLPLHDDSDIFSYPPTSLIEIEQHLNELVHRQVIDPYTTDLTTIDGLSIPTTLDQPIRRRHLHGHGGWRRQQTVEDSPTGMEQRLSSSSAHDALWRLQLMPPSQPNGLLGDSSQKREAEVEFSSFGDPWTFFSTKNGVSETSTYQPIEAVASRAASSEGELPVLFETERQDDKAALTHLHPPVPDPVKDLQTPASGYQPWTSNSRSVAHTPQQDLNLSIDVSSNDNTPPVDSGSASANSSPTSYPGLLHPRPLRFIPPTEPHLIRIPNNVYQSRTHAEHPAPSIVRRTSDDLYRSHAIGHTAQRDQPNHYSDAHWHDSKWVADLMTLEAYLPADNSVMSCPPIQTDDDFLRRCSVSSYASTSSTLTGSPQSASSKSNPKEKKYPCPICGKHFARAFNLQTHIATHQGIRPFDCPAAGCSKAFSRRHDLCRHLNSIHSRWLKSAGLTATEAVAPIRARQGDSSTLAPLTRGAGTVNVSMYNPQTRIKHDDASSHSSVQLLSNSSQYPFHA